MYQIRGSVQTNSSHWVFLSRKSPIGSNQWEVYPPLITVSLYIVGIFFS
ncbi:hypothetical protein IEQ_04448 [Bacillus cereus BAG6X1-2]|nr:hypothetical protein IEQ_04448 [Bacillus cereus BAG6X1-2]